MFNYPVDLPSTIELSPHHFTHPDRLHSSDSLQGLQILDRLSQRVGGKDSQPIVPRESALWHLGEQALIALGDRTHPETEEDMLKWAETLAGDAIGAID